MEYEEAISRGMHPEHDWRPLDELLVSARKKALVYWSPEDFPEDSAGLVADYVGNVEYRVTKERERWAIEARHGINAVFKDDEALNSLLHALYLSVHAADPDHDVHEHAQEFAERVVADLSRPFEQS